MYSFRKTIDQILNRFLTGNYIGLSPKSPRLLAASLFVEIGTNMDIADIIDEKIKKSVNPKASLKHGLIVCDGTTWKIAGEKIFFDLAKKYKKPDCMLINSNSFFEVKNIVSKSVGFLKDLYEVSEEKDEIEQKYGKVSCGLKKYNIIYAVGGGSVIDVAKYVAKKLHIPYVSIPTSLANDGIASQFAVLNLGEDRVRTLKANVPLGVIVDTSLIKSKDPYYERRIRSGIGDLLSNITASLDWELAASLDKSDLRREPVDEVAKHQALFGAETVLSHILEARDIYNSDNFLKMLAAALIHSGEAMGRYGSSRPASGFEHKLYHAYNEVMNYNTMAMHGEIVAVGTLISAYAHKSDYERLVEACKLVGLPVSREDLESIGMDISSIEKAIVKIADEPERFKCDRYTIFERIGWNKMIECLEAVYPEKKEEE